LREDALLAISLTSKIVEQQFGWFGAQPWFIEGVTGASFVKRQCEAHPFIKRFVLPQCPCVGVRCAIKGGHPHGYADFDDYGDGELTDEEFREAYNTRDPASIAGT
jgi:hypothetical protein